MLSTNTNTKNVKISYSDISSAGYPEEVLYVPEAVPLASTPSEAGYFEETYP